MVEYLAYLRDDAIGVVARYGPGVTQRLPSGADEQVLAFTVAHELLSCAVMREAVGPDEGAGVGPVS